MSIRRNSEYQRSARVQHNKTRLPRGTQRFIRRELERGAAAMRKTGSVSSPLVADMKRRRELHDLIGKQVRAGAVAGTLLSLNDRTSCVKRDDGLIQNVDTSTIKSDDK